MRYASVLLLCSCACLGQTSQELHSRYGQPDVERFVARPKITATVQYGTDAQACQIVIEVEHPLLPAKHEYVYGYMRPETVTAIIDEIAPPSVRGSKVDTLYEDMGCAHGETTEYETAVISRATDQCVPLKPERESSATIAFKRSACPATFTFSKDHSVQQK